MPTVPTHLQSHRERESRFNHFLHFCAVARKVKRQEVITSEAATAAVDSEWNKLATMPHPDGKGTGVWDILGVREKADVVAEARRNNQ